MWKRFIDQTVLQYSVFIVKIDHSSMTEINTDANSDLIIQ